MKDEVGAELALPHFRIDLAQAHRVGLLASCERSGESGLHTVDVVLVHLSLDLVVAQVVDLPYLLTGSYALAEFHVQQSQFAIDRCSHF